jgi:hypothetical protein
VAEVAKFIEERTRNVARTLPDSTAELRSVFHGPPVKYLRAALTHLAGDNGIECEVADGGRIIVPVLLPLDEVPVGSVMPLAGESGVCDRQFLIALRNTGYARQWLALTPPGTHSAKSVTGATDEFGVSSEANGGNATIAEWFDDALVQRLAEAALSRHQWHSDNQRDQARRLLEGVVNASDEADRHDSQRDYSWAALARVLGITTNHLSFPVQWSLACGVPPMADGSLNAEEQVRVLSEIAEIILNDGYAACAERLKKIAVGDEVEAIDAMLAHLRARADVALALSRGPQFFYASSISDELAEPPIWYVTLTADRLAELLEEDIVRPGTLKFFVANPLVRAGRGLPYIVKHDITLRIELPTVGETPSEVVIAREGAGRGNARQWTRNILETDAVIDSEVPIHSQPIRYVASGDGLKRASVRVISLDSWEPGLIVWSQTATKLSLPKRSRTEGIAYECHLALAGEGRHFLDLLVRANCRLDEFAHGEDVSTAGSGVVTAPIAMPSEGLSESWGVEVNATTECYYDIPITAANNTRLIIRIHITSEEVGTQGCRSEFERLIRLNQSFDRARPSLEVQVDRQVRIADLQSWLLDADSVDASFLPLVIAPDCAQAWSQPNWSTLSGTVISKGHYIHDPRPPIADFDPPEGFLQARREIAARIRGEDGHGLIESAELGQWCTDHSFAEIVDEYVRSYLLWLDAEPEVAPWVDVSAIATLEADGALSQIPRALLVSPLHPLRIGWHTLAQRTLWEAFRSGKPCPAATIVAPFVVPDALSLPLRTAAGGISRITFLSADVDTDYWSVLWNSNQLGELTTKGIVAPFDRDFGIQVGGLASGFNESQVRRALDDVSFLFAAKPTLNVLVTSSAAQGTACNDGLISWAKNHFGASPESPDLVRQLGGRSMQVFDERRSNARPEEAEIANLAEDTAGAVKWFAATPKGMRPDLGIIAQLETSNASAEPTLNGSPLGRGALVRQRIRTQLKGGNGAFLSESRMGVVGPPSGDALADHVATLTARIENLDDRRLGYMFAPSTKTIQSLLSEKDAELVAVSSSAVDPACFLGGWLDRAYLWDYELPSYSHRPGDTSGYYLLSKVKELDSDALRVVISRLPECANLTTETIDSILLEVARRGIPTVRGLSAGHSGASGDLGLFLAGRLLQDEFRMTASSSSLMPILTTDGEAYEVALIVPVDPFRGYLADLQKAVGSKSFLRPDIVVVAIRVTDSRVACRITPVEVKYRQEILSGAGARDALGQAAALADLLERIRRYGDGPLMWKLAFQHLLLSFVDFGFRVYSQRLASLREPQEWATLHQRVATTILSDDASVEIDRIGRLIAFDGSGQSGARDFDGDGFTETIVISSNDSARILRGEATGLYSEIVHLVADWNFLPLGERIAIRPEPEQPAGRIVDANQLEGMELPPEEAPVADEPSGLDNLSVAPEVSIPPSSNIEDIPVREASGDVSVNSPEKSTALGIVVNIGKSADGFRSDERVFRPSLTDLNQLNIGVVGDLGTGKTQLVKSLIYQMTAASASNDGVTPRFLIFDYKNDYASQDFVEAVGAKVVSPYHLPLNLFDTSGIVTQPAWMPRFKFFADILDKIYGGVGPVQRHNLRAAVQGAFDATLARGRPATIYDVHDRYEAIVNGKPDAPLSIISDMVMMELFTREPVSSASFEQFFDGVVVISLSTLGQDNKSKNMVVAIMLNLFYEYMLTLPKRPYRGSNPQLRTLDSYLLVDEADNIMKYEFDVLRTILLQGREFGVGVLLASQYLKHFKSGATDYREPLLTWFIHKVPNVTPQELSALGLPATASQLAERVKQLPNHHCLYKTFDIAGSEVAATPFYQLRNKSA